MGDVLDGIVTSAHLVDSTEDELLSTERQAEKRKICEESLRSVLLNQVELDLWDPNLQCPRCNAMGARYAVVCDTGSIPIDGSSGHKRQKTKKRIHAQCSVCE